MSVDSLNETMKPVRLKIAKRILYPFPSHLGTPPHYHISFDEGAVCSQRS